MKKAAPAPSAGQTASPPAPRDLADFHLRWGQFRPEAKSLLAAPHLSDHQRMVLGWLIEMADRIGPEDLQAHL